MFVIPAGGRSSYQIQNSIRLRSSASAYFSRTFGTPTSGTLFTFSAWVKRGTLGVFQPIFSPDYAGGEGLMIDASDKLQVSRNGAVHMLSTQVFRDPSAWFHVVLASDMANGTAANRVRVWINNAEITSWGTDARASFTSWVYWNTAVTHRIADSTATANFFDGLLSDIYFIDGQALTPSSFGEQNSDGVWVPKAYTGTYGSNGFHLLFADQSAATAAAIGKDSSGNGNNWTPSGIYLTTSTNYQWDGMADTPTSNYAVLNGLITNAVASMGVAGGNLNLTRSSAGWASLSSTVRISSGKWYWEVTPTVATTSQMFGIQTTEALGEYPGQVTTSWGYYTSSGQKYNNAVGSAYGSAYSGSNPIGVALDMDNGKIWFSRDGVFENSGVPASGTNAAFTGITGEVVPSFGLNAASTACSVNHGQRPFTYTPPTGFKALCTSNLPAVAITNPKKHFDVTTWTGSNSTGSRTITGLSLQPDMVWGKDRTSAFNHQVYDSVRGTGKSLMTSGTSAEDTTNVSGSISAFNSDGFTASVGGTDNWYWNKLNDNYVAWLWKANGAGTTNTAGSITSTVSANTTAGFSIVTYTGTGANATVGHGLGKVPSLVIVKSRTVVNSWQVYHASLTSAAYALLLESTSAQFSYPTGWNSTAPTSSVFSIGTSANVNTNLATHVAYCFAEVPGFSKFGAYQGSSGEGAYVHCGFRPRWVMIKSYSGGTTDWFILDTSRNTYNATNNYLLADTSGAAADYSDMIDVTAFGFKIKAPTGASINFSSSVSYIYAAFSEYPNGSNVAPAPAR